MHRLSPSLVPRRLVLLVSLAVATLAACSSLGAVSSPTGRPASIEGRTFLSTSVKGAVLAPGTRIRLGFKDGQLSASGGCNSMGGAYVLSNGRLSTAGLAMTDMGCDAHRMEQDQWLARLLNGANVTLTGDMLTIDDGRVQVTLQDREVADADRPLEGTRWILDGIASGDAASSVPAGVTTSIQIVGGRVKVEAGCNTGDGSASVAAGTVTFGVIALTKKACQPDAMAVERAVVGMLTGPVPYRIEADVLRLDAGRNGLTFRAEPPRAPNPTPA